MARKRIGFQVMIFLIVLSGLLYFTKKKVWADAARVSDCHRCKLCDRQCPGRGLFRACRTL